VKKIASWSFSAIEQFRNCPRQYQAERITKEVPYVEGPHQKHGNWVHKMFEDRINKNRTLPPELKEFEPVLKRIKEWPAVRAEMALAIDDKLQPTEYFSKTAWCRAKIDVWSVDGNLCRIVDWKGLPLTTPIATPDGFTTMGALSVGDYVLGGSGRPCRVVGKSAVNIRPCYTVHFDDRTSVVCDNVHLWSTTRGVVPVEELEEGDEIPVSGPAEHTEKELRIDPYVLGLWLADGKHTSGEITKPDAFVWNEIARRGFSVGDDYSGLAKCETRTVLGLRTGLREMGLLGSKHIPQQYLHGSIQQRTDLLRGLMDGDGNANPARKQAVFTTTDKALSDQVKQLVESLGQRVNQACVTARGFGVETIAYPLSWRPQHGLNPFLLPRKADRISPEWGAGNSWCRRVVDVTPEDPRETQCISVDSDDNTYLCTSSYIPTHNTGKRKYDYDQLLLNALVTMCHFPEVDTVKSAFFWTKEPDKKKQFDVETFSREHWHDYWQRFLPDVALLQQAVDLNVWQERPSGLCNGWCRVESCPYWKPKREKK
jgi:hypothetical protein